MISTQQIAYILAIVDNGNVSRAAEQCFVTQPTLSMQLKKAEEQLGFPVFHRDTSKLELSVFGRELVPLLRQIQADFSSIERLKQEFSGTFRERLRIGIIPTIAAYLLQDCFAEWRTLVPRSQLLIEELKTEELLEALETKKIDLAILAGPVEMSGLRSIPLFTEEIRAYIPSIKSKTISVSALQQLHPWLLSKGNCLRTQMMQFCSIEGEQPDSWNYTGGNIDMLMRMVDINGGYTLIPSNYGAIYPARLDDFKRVRDDAGRFPGRSVIAVSSFRHANWDSMEKIIRSVQLKYPLVDGKEIGLLNWK